VLFLPRSTSRQLRRPKEPGKLQVQPEAGSPKAGVVQNMAVQGGEVAGVGLLVVQLVVGLALVLDMVYYYYYTSYYHRKEIYWKETNCAKVVWVNWQQ